MKKRVIYLTVLPAIMGVILFVLPAITQGARPNSGKWSSGEVTFRVKQGHKIWGFRPKYRVEWVCRNGDTPWTKVRGITARVSRRGGFRKTSRVWIGSIGRRLTVHLRGRFVKPRRARGVLKWELAGCGSFRDRWTARGPAAPSGDTGPDPGPIREPCIWIQLADGSYMCTRSS